MLDAADWGLVRELVAQQSKAALQAATRGGVIGVPALRLGTVIGWIDPHTVALVLVDGDASPIHVQNVSGDGPPLGARVQVLFDPPQGIFLVGTLVPGPVGLLGYAYITANYTAPAGLDKVVPGLSVTVTVGERRAMKSSAHTVALFENGGNTPSFKIFLDGVQIQQWNGNPGGGGTGASAIAVNSPNPGAHTWDVRISPQLAANTATVLAGPNFPSILMVEDIGPDI